MRLNGDAAKVFAQKKVQNFWQNGENNWTSAYFKQHKHHFSN